MLDVLKAREQRLLGTLGNFVPHENADLVQLLPLAIEREQRADFKIPSGDIKTVGEISPIVKVATDLPVLVAVVYDEEVAPLLP